MSSSSYTYNGAGNPTSTTDALAAEAKVEYNDDGTVKKSIDPGNGTNGTTYSYNTSKQLTTMTPPTGNGLATKTFTYDPFGRLKTVTNGACDPATRLTKYGQRWYNPNTAASPSRTT